MRRRCSGSCRAVGRRASLRAFRLVRESSSAPTTIPSRDATPTECKQHWGRCVKSSFAPPDDQESGMLIPLKPRMLSIHDNRPYRVRTSDLPRKPDPMVALKRRARELTLAGKYSKAAALYQHLLE